MFDMAKSSIILFFQGKLFSDPASAVRQIAIGAGLTALLAVVLAKLGIPLIAVAIIVGLLGGALQPYLFKDLRYR